MKKTCLSFIMVLMFLLLSGCNTSNKVTIKNGDYLEKTKAEISVIISDGKFGLFNLIDSNSATNGVSGTYVIDDDTLTMTTDDNNYTYVFKIDGDNLIFQKNDSLIDDKIGVKIKDNAKFHLISD